MIEYNKSFEKLFSEQEKFQKLIEGVNPHDNPVKFEYHIAAMVEELGEVLKADKRWKTHRNTTFIAEEKLDEIADVFITAINLALWSGFNVDMVIRALNNKISENFKRWEDKQKDVCDS